MESGKNHIFSPAKLNVGLRIVGCRQDGFHLLESLFWPVDLCDEIEISPSNRPHHHVSMDWISPEPRKDLIPLSEQENIVWKVLSEFSSEKYSVEIKKQIAPGGGLGGGSSNAGSVFRLLQKAYGARLPEADEISKFGADIPFFLNPVPSWVTGIGEKITPLRMSEELLENLHFAVLILPEGCSTPEVFARYRKKGGSFSTSRPPMTELTTYSLMEYLATCRNDLVEAAGEGYPLIPKVISFLRSLPDTLYADMSGSGSTCYSLFPSKNVAEKNIKEIDRFCREYLSKGITVKTYKF